MGPKPDTATTQDQAVAHAATAGDAAIARAIVHEVANPLNAIAMNADLADLLLQRAQPERLPAVLRAIRDDCARCARIMRDIHECAAVAEGPRQAVDAAQLLRELAGQQRSRGVVGVRPAHIAPPAVVHVDRTALRRALLALLDNAFDHGASRVDVILDQRPARLAIRLVDDGPGIDTGMLSRLFEPFVTSRPRQHTGLGLAIAARVATAHGGTLQARNHAEGAELCLCLPLAVTAP